MSAHRIQLDSSSYDLPEENRFVQRYPDLFRNELCTISDIKEAGLEVEVIRTRKSVRQLIEAGAHYIAFRESADQLEADIRPLEELRPDLEFCLKGSWDDSEFDNVQEILPIARILGDCYWTIKDPDRPPLEWDPGGGPGSEAGEAALPVEEVA